MIRHEYGAGAVKWALWFFELRVTLELLAQNIDEKEIKRKVVEENLYATGSQARALMIYSHTMTKVKLLDKSFIPLFLSADTESQKLFALAMAMNHDTLFFDLVFEVVREKMLLGVNEFNNLDVMAFFRNKQSQDAKAAKWTDATINRLARAYKHMLNESGLTDKGKDVQKINYIFFDERLEKWLYDNGYEPIVKAIRGK